MKFSSKYLLPIIAGFLGSCTENNKPSASIDESLVKYSIQKLEASPHLRPQERKSLTGPNGQKLSDQLIIADREITTTKACPLVFQNIGPADPVAIMHIDCGLSVKNRTSLVNSSFIVAPRQNKRANKIELSDGVFATPTDEKIFEILKKSTIGTKFRAKFIRHSADAVGWVEILLLEHEP